MAHRSNNYSYNPQYNQFNPQPIPTYHAHNIGTFKISKKVNKGILDFWHDVKLSSLVLPLCLVLLLFVGLIYFGYNSEDNSSQKTNKSRTNLSNRPNARVEEETEVDKRIREINEASREQQIQINEEKLTKQNKQKQKEAENQKQLVNNKRRSQVKQAFIHAINGYSTHAYGFDEIRPETNETNSSWGGFGVTLFDSLDTMLIMGLKDAYLKAREHVLSVDFEKDHDASFFEFTIRYIGGLLGAFELTRDEKLLFKAKDMADRLLYAFDSPTGIPYSIVNLKSHKAKGPRWNGGASVLSEVGSVQLEFKYLSHHLRDPTYAEKSHKVIELLENMLKESSFDVREGLYPVYMDPERGTFTNDLVSYGGLGDSFYEYLLKQYLLTGKTDEAMLHRYLDCVEGMSLRMLGRSAPNNMLFLGEYRLTSNKMLPEMDHLVCYVPGMLALGAEGAHEKLHMKLAEELAGTCYQLYAEQKTGIGPERVEFFPSTTTNKMTPSKPAEKKADASKEDVDAMKRGRIPPSDNQDSSARKSNAKDYRIMSPRYLLRPETVESLFVLYRKTQNETYREWAWKIFESIEYYCKTGSAYSGLMDVTNPDTELNNSMQSFFLAETLKYLYLIFSEDTLIPLDTYVFTTEAHPLGIIK